MPNNTNNQEVLGPRWDQCPPEWKYQQSEVHASTGYVEEYRTMLSQVVDVDYSSVEV